MDRPWNEHASCADASASRKRWWPDAFVDEPEYSQFRSSARHFGLRHYEVIQRKAPAEFVDFVFDLFLHGIIVNRAEHPVHQIDYPPELILLESAGRHRGGPNANAAGHERALVIERNHILV